MAITNHVTPHVAQRAEQNCFDGGMLSYLVIIGLIPMSANGDYWNGARVIGPDDISPLRQS